jgi:hypothetical protein
MKSISKLLVIAVVVVAALGCRTSNRTTLAADTCAGGYLGNADDTRPLVCVATAGMTAPKIDPVHVYAKGRNGAATQITWASADRNADLHVTTSSTECVKSVSCPEKQACFATIVDSVPAGTHCEYQISNGSAKPTDPIIIVDTCCGY